MTQMTATIQQWLESMGIGQKGKFGLLEIFGSTGDRFSACAVSSAGLVISAGGSALAKTGAATTTFVTSAPGAAASTLVQIAGGTNMPALVGNISAGAFNVYCFFVDSAGVVTVFQGTEGATLAAVKFPAFPTGQALVGFLTVTYASQFVGGTTPLDTATTTYNSPTGAWDPSVLVGVVNY